MKRNQTILQNKKVKLKKISLSTLKKILQGLIAFIFKFKTSEVRFRKRYNVCKTCDKIDFTGKECYVKGTQPCCSVCGCSLALLLRSKDGECELKKW